MFLDDDLGNYENIYRKAKTTYKEQKFREALRFYEQVNFPLLSHHG